MQRFWLKGSKLHLCRMSKSRGLMYNVMTIVNITTLNTGNMLREQILGVLNHTHTNNNYVRKRYVNYLDYSNNFTMYMYTENYVLHLKCIQFLL